MQNIDKIILTSLSDLDLTPTMEKNARDKYHAISKYLNEQGLECDFYPQGSFLIGISVRPYKNGTEHDYDLDIVSVLNREKIETTAEKVKNDVGNCIKTSKLYRERLEKEDTFCWTIKYADISEGVGFSLDIVPAVNECISIKNEVLMSGVEFSKTQKILAITKKSDIYEWETSNPLGFGDWFIEISNRHLTREMIKEQYENLPVEIRMQYRSVEEIPNFYYKSNLQRAVQFIKRHRDIYYDRSNRNSDKPSSILLTALIADSVKNEYLLSISEIIKNFIIKFKSSNISIMKDNKILNPVDLRENFIEFYTESQKILFENWLEELEQFINTTDELRFKQLIHNDINTRMFTDIFKNVEKVSPVKPWENIYDR